MDEVDAHFHPKKTEPTPPFTEKQKAWAKDFLTTPCQYDLHEKRDDYTHTLEKQLRLSKSRSSASEVNASKSASGSKASTKRSDVLQLEEQAKQSIPPLVVLSDESLLMQQ